MSISKSSITDELQTGVPIKALTRIVLGVNTEALHDDWVSIYKYNCRYRGKLESIKYMKALYGQAVSYSMYQQLPHISFRKTIKCGLVKDLASFKPYLRGSVPKTRAALTILRQYEMLYTEPSYDISTVTDPCTKSSLWYRWAFTRWMKTTDRKLPVIILGKPKDHQTSKKGPSGKAALLSWDADALNLPQHLIDTMCRLSELMGDELFTKRIEAIRQWLSANNFTTNSECHSRIQVFPAGGGKTRIIAIYDYWSQRTLKPLHQAIFKNLRKVNEDATFGHGSAADWLKTIPKGIDIYCYDLTAATDRIPYWIHDIVLEQHLPENENSKEIARLVKDLLLNRDFTLSWDRKQAVRYACGQPMGAYGSWALLAYSHHCIARFCGARRNEYRIIGDDIVILGNAGLKYRKFMNANGIKISEAKSIISRKDDLHQTGEVAKRLILDGKEISPPTPKLIYKTFRDWRLAPMLLEDMVRRGWELRTDTLLEVLYNLYSKRWADYIITVLSFPFTNGDSALYFQGVTESCSKWKEQDISELAINFVRYRIHLLDKAGTKAMGSVSIDDTTMFKVLMKAPLDETDPAIYSLGPLPNIRSEMSMKMAKTNRRLVECVKEISNATSETIVVPRIQDEELYYPDFSLQFLETKYRRQQYLSNTLITFKRHIDNGTLQNILKDAGGILL